MGCIKLCLHHVFTPHFSALFTKYCFCLHFSLFRLILQGSLLKSHYSVFKCHYSLFSTHDSEKSPPSRVRYVQARGGHPMDHCHAVKSLSVGGGRQSINKSIIQPCTHLIIQSIQSLQSLLFHTIGPSSRLVLMPVVQCPSLHSKPVAINQSTHHFVVSVNHLVRQIRNQTCNHSIIASSIQQSVSRASPFESRQYQLAELAMRCREGGYPKRV